MHISWSKRAPGWRIHRAARTLHLSESPVSHRKSNMGPKPAILLILTTVLLARFPLTEGETTNLPTQSVTTAGNSIQLTAKSTKTHSSTQKPNPMTGGPLTSTPKTSSAVALALQPALGLLVLNIP
uniref:Uncharacterized protein n=1 Tax=Schistocephalus solidus TaxID=70667 RepID=A0A0V0JA53_SCHSO